MFTIDLHVILSIIVATGVYTFLLKFLQKNLPHNVQTKGGGVKGLLNNVQKTALFLKDGFPKKQTIVPGKCVMIYKPDAKNSLYVVGFISF